MNDIIVPVKSSDEKRKSLIKSMNDAIEMKEKIRHDDMLRKVYYDFDFDKYIDMCRDLLGGEWEDIGELEVPF